jgi:hypothetical protein
MWTYAIICVILYWLYRRFRHPKARSSPDSTASLTQKTPQDNAAGPVESLRAESAAVESKTDTATFRRGTNPSESDTRISPERPINQNSEPHSGPARRCRECPPLTDTSTDVEGVQCLQFYVGNDLTIREDLQIRLLEISPDTSKELHCNLITRPLKSEEGKFYALSYACGTADKKYSIRIDGMRYDKSSKREIVCHETRAVVRQNLYQALIALRHRGILRVWNDALCLNSFNEQLVDRPVAGPLLKQAKEEGLDNDEDYAAQAETDMAKAIKLHRASRAEKNRMIPEMGRVYRTAAATCAWLGSAGPGTERLFYSLKREAECLSVMPTISSLNEAPLKTSSGQLKKLFEEELRRAWREYTTASKGRDAQIHEPCEMDDNDKYDLNDSSSGDLEHNGVQFHTWMISTIQAYLNLDDQGMKYEQLNLKLTEHIRLVRQYFREHSHYMFDLFGREFWTRKWIIQELASSPTVRFCSGNDGKNDLIWEQLVLPSDMFFESDFFHSKDVRLLGMRNFVFLYNVRARVRQGNPMHLFWLLRNSATFNSGRLEDLMLPLQSLAFDSDLHIPVPVYRDKQDEAGSLRSLLCEASVNRIRMTRNLDSMCLGTTEEHAAVLARGYCLALPSWVPNVVAPSSRGGRFLKYFCGEDWKPGLSTETHKWVASGNSQWTGTILHDRVGDVSELLASGIRIGKIGGIVYSPLVARERDLSHFVHEHAWHTERVAPSGDFQDALARAVSYTLISNLTVDRPVELAFNLAFMFNPEYQTEEAERMIQAVHVGRGMDREEWSNFISLVRIWISGCSTVTLYGKRVRFFMHRDTVTSDSDTQQRDGKLWNGIQRPRVLFDEEERERQVKTGTSSQKAQQRFRSRVFEALCRAATDQMSFMTIIPDPERGDYEDAASAVVGWAHPMANLSDEIFLLQGCSVPVILRLASSSKHGSRCYEVIGDAWVNGTMDGTFWRSSLKNGRALSDVRIV